MLHNGLLDFLHFFQSVFWALLLPGQGGLLSEKGPQTLRLELLGPFLQPQAEARQLEDHVLQPPLQLRGRPRPGSVTQGG